MTTDSIPIHPGEPRHPNEAFVRDSRQVDRSANSKSRAFQEESTEDPELNKIQDKSGKSARDSLLIITTT